MGCACNGGGTPEAEYEVRTPTGQVIIVQGKAAAELAVKENGGGIIKKKV